MAMIASVLRRLLRTRSMRRVGMLGLIVIASSCRRNCETTRSHDPPSGVQRTDDAVVGIHVVATLDRIVRVNEAGWDDFEGVCVFRLVEVVQAQEPARGALRVGQPLNVVVTKRGPRSEFFRTERPSEDLRLGEEYELRLGERLPTGWGAIAGQFADDRIGLVAALEIGTRRP